MFIYCDGLLESPLGDSLKPRVTKGNPGDRQINDEPFGRLNPGIYLHFQGISRLKGSRTFLTTQGSLWSPWA
jgi:hypothetical protein